MRFAAGAAEFVQVVPGVWDETRAIRGEIGQYVAIARRKGADWFLGVMTNSQRRTLEIPLSFLGDGRYEAKLFVDAANADSDPTSLQIREMIATREGVVMANMAVAGGLAGWFRKL